jgi:hypothetical protein
MSMWLKKTERLWARSDGVFVRQSSIPGDWIAFGKEEGEGRVRRSARTAMVAADEAWPAPDPLPAVVDVSENTVGEWRDDAEFVDWLHRMGWVWTDDYTGKMRHLFDSAPRDLVMMHKAWCAGRRV